MTVLGALVIAALTGGFGYIFSWLLREPDKTSTTDAHVASSRPSSEFYVEEPQSFCSLVTSSDSVDPGQTYRISWEGRSGGEYWLVNDTSRLSVDYTGFYDFVWKEDDTLKVFELRGAFNGAACTAYATIFEKTEQPRCLIVADTDLVEPGGSFRVNWFGYPNSNTVFRVNGTIVDPRDAASYIYPEGRERPIDFVMSGANAAGKCEEVLTVWPK